LLRRKKERRFDKLSANGLKYMDAAPLHHVDGALNRFHAKPRSDQRLRAFRRLVRPGIRPADD
jgi:hypothetical protein